MCVNVRTFFFMLCHKGMLKAGCDSLIYFTFLFTACFIFLFGSLCASLAI